MVAALLLVKLGQVVGAVGLGILNLQLLGQLVVVIEVILCQLNLLHLEVALRKGRMCLG